MSFLTNVSRSGRFYGVQLLCAGDSHLYAVRQAAKDGLIQADDCRFSIVPGATAVGLRNPNSITDAVSTFKEDVYKEPTDICLLIQLGEVDCGFTIWYRAGKYGESVEQQTSESLRAYRQFVTEIMEQGYKRICLTGAIIPTIRDGADFGDVANARSEIRVPLYDRTQLTLKYNERLRAMSQELGISYFDFTREILQEETKVVDDRFRNTDPWNHHLDPVKVAPFWATLCNKFLLLHKGS